MQPTWMRLPSTYFHPLPKVHLYGEFCLLTPHTELSPTDMSFNDPETFFQDLEVFIHMPLALSSAQMPFVPEATLFISPG